MCKNVITILLPFGSILKTKYIYKEKEQHKNHKNNYIYLVLQNFVTRIHIIIQGFVGNK